MRRATLSPRSRKRFPNIKGPAAQDICYATENRQVAVKHVASDADLLLVVGSDNSSNSKRLVEVARSLGTPAHLIDDCRRYSAAVVEWREDGGPDCGSIGSGTSGAGSGGVSWRGKGFGDVQELEIMPENVRFGLPPEIVETIAAAPAMRRGDIDGRILRPDSTEYQISASAPQMRFGKIDDLGSRVAVAVDAARKYLFSQQHEEGYWCGELEADTTLESDYILLHTLLGTGNQERFEKAARYILNHQNEDGGWSIYAGGPSNISASVKAYFGLKLAGYHGRSSRAGARPQEDS